MTEILGGALLTIGGSLQLAFAVQLLRGRRTGRGDCPELAIAYPVSVDTPPDLTALIEQLG